MNEPQTSPDGAEPSSFAGLSAFPITPSDPDGRVQAAALRRLVRRLADAGVDSVGLLGSTGTYPYLSRAERRRALDEALDEANGRVPMVVGVGALRTDEAVRLAQDAKAAGAAGGLLAPVSYVPLSDEEVFAHFSAVAAGSGLPIVVYDNPGTTHFRFTPALVARLSRITGIVAVKSPAADPAATAAHLRQLRDLVPVGFGLGYSVDWCSADAMIAGADTWFSVAAGLFPQSCAAIARAATAGHAAEARRLDDAMRPLWELFREFTSLRVMYAAFEILDLGRAEPPRPVLPLSSDARRRVAEVLRANAFS